jgi:hypothetical protein
MYARRLALMVPVMAKTWDGAVPLAVYFIVQIRHLDLTANVSPSRPEREHSPRNGTA